MEKTDFRNEHGVIWYTLESYEIMCQTNLTQLVREAQTHRVVVLDENFEYLGDVKYYGGEIITFKPFKIGS